MAAPAAEKSGEPTEVEKKIKNLKKKLRQIDELTEKKAAGAELDAGQTAKVRRWRGVIPSPVTVCAAPLPLFHTMATCFPRPRVNPSCGPPAATVVPCDARTRAALLMARPSALRLAGCLAGGDRGGDRQVGVARRA